MLGSFLFDVCVAIEEGMRVSPETGGLLGGPSRLGLQVFLPGLSEGVRRPQLD